MFVNHDLPDSVFAYITENGFSVKIYPGGRMEVYRAIIWSSESLHGFEEGYDGYYQAIGKIAEYSPEGELEWSA